MYSGQKTGMRSYEGIDINVWDNHDQRDGVIMINVMIVPVIMTKLVMMWMLMIRNVEMITTLIIIINITMMVMPTIMLMMITT